MNCVVLIGNVAKEVETYTTQGGVKRATFTLAVNRKYRNAQGVREADFFSCVAWRNTAEFVEKNVAKGKKVAVQGEIQNRSYDTQDGSKRTVTEIIVDEIEFCGAKGEAKEETKQEMIPADDEEPPF